MAGTQTAPGKALQLRIVDALVHRIGKDTAAALPHDWLAATIYTLRDDIIERWMVSSKAAHAAGAKRVYYLSLEFLIGRLLRDALSNLGVSGDVRAALSEHGVDLDEILEIEPDAALGNGGLGRLAACFMESLATLDIPAYGYGIRYVNGMFNASTMAGRSSCLRAGSRMVTRGSSNAGRVPIVSASVVR
jgi:starch phosphorylase